MAGDDYSHDVFISYRRSHHWPVFVREVLQPMLEHWLSAELGGDARVFIDTELETGDRWPQKLAHKLAEAKVMIPLFSYEYWSSEWCQTELAVMLKREELLGLRDEDLWPAPDKEHGIIFPLQIHDGEYTPKRLGLIQTTDIVDYASPFLNKESKAFYELSELIREFARDVAKGVKRAPPFKPKWRRLAVEQFEDALVRVQRLLSDAPKAKMTGPPSLAGKSKRKKKDRE